MNTGGVNNGATGEPRFTFSTSVEIVSLYDYHWNNGMGDTPGTIAIENVGTNELYGPFITTDSRDRGEYRTYTGKPNPE